MTTKLGRNPFEKNADIKLEIKQTPLKIEHREQIVSQSSSLMKLIGAEFYSRATLLRLRIVRHTLEPVLMIATSFGSLTREPG
jgi:hypothetical protein